MARKTTYRHLLNVSFDAQNIKIVNILQRIINKPNYNCYLKQYAVMKTEVETHSLVARKTTYRHIYSLSIASTLSTIKKDKDRDQRHVFLMVKMIVESRSLVAHR